MPPRRPTVLGGVPGGLRAASNAGGPSVYGQPANQGALAMQQAYAPEPEPQQPRMPAPQPVVMREPVVPSRVPPLAESAGGIFKKATGLWKRQVLATPEPQPRPEPQARPEPRGPASRAVPQDEMDIPAFLRRQSN